MYRAVSIAMAASSALLSNAQPTRLMARDSIHHPTYLDSFNYTSAPSTSLNADGTPAYFKEYLSIAFHQDKGGSTASSLPSGSITCTLGANGTFRAFYPGSGAEATNAGLFCTAPDNSKLPDGFSVVDVSFQPMRPADPKSGKQPTGTNRNIELQFFPTGNDHKNWEGYEYQRGNIFADDIFTTTNSGVPPFTATLKQGGQRLHENGNDKGF